jgi:hypothetical protein
MSNAAIKNGNLKHGDEGGTYENYEAAGIRQKQEQFEVAAGFEPHSRCNVKPIVLLPKNVKNKRADIISMKRLVTYHINIRYFPQV